MSRKCLLIMRSEFWRRVTSKTFILTTLLGPALLMGLIALVVIGISFSIDDEFGGDNASLRIAIVDETRVLGDQIIQENDSHHLLFNADLGSARRGVQSGDMDAYILIPQSIISGESQPVLYSSQDRGFGVQLELGGMIERSLEDHLLLQANVTIDVRAILDRSISLEYASMEHEGDPSTLNGSADDTDDEVGLIMLGTILAMIMYLTILVYGSLILYGVMEERTTRVVEIIVSSVRPLDLMMGKVVGIGFVGLAQILTWILMIVGALIFASPMIGLFADPALIEASSSPVSSQEIMSSLDFVLSQLSIQLVIGILLYFIGGYLMYGGFYAAVGTMVDSPQEAQTLLLPMIIPMVIPMMFLSVILLSPNSAVSMGLSMFPLTSPVTMTVRLAVGAVPTWQLVISLGALIASVFGAIWVSSRIYRASILMYGKKSSLKTMLTYLQTS